MPNVPLLPPSIGSMFSATSGNLAIAPLLRHPCGPAHHVANGTVRHRGQSSRDGRVPGRASAGDEVYDGVYGPWKVEREDELEVLAYRAGLSVGAVSLALGTAISFVPESWPIYEPLSGAYNPLCIAGAAGLGASYFLIHIYVTPLKRLLQGMWGVGVAGGLFLMLNHAEPLPAYVAQNPGAVWLVGPFFAAITGLAFKEGLCYGTLEAGLLFLLTPALLLGHLSGVVSDDVVHVMAAAFAVLFGLFAVRKYSQAIKDDIGDKSVFDFQKMPPEQQENLMRQLEMQRSEE